MVSIQPLEIWLLTKQDIFGVVKTRSEVLQKMETKRQKKTPNKLTSPLRVWPLHLRDTR